MFYDFWVGFARRCHVSFLDKMDDTLFSSSSCRNCSLLCVFFWLRLTLDWIYPDVPDPLGVWSPIPLYILLYVKFINYHSILSSKSKIWVVLKLFRSIYARISASLNSVAYLRLVSLISIDFSSLSFAYIKRNVLDGSILSISSSFVYKKRATLVLSCGFENLCFTTSIALFGGF